MTTSCVNLLHPIEAATVDVLGRLVKTAKTQAVDVLLVGAFAREVLFYHLLGIDTGIGTLDTDISVLVPNWGAFNHLRHALAEEGFRAVQDDVPEKLREDASGIEVDLIPFGPIAGKDFRLHWPQNGPVWNVMGFQESFDSALLLPLTEAGRGQLTIPLITIPSLFMLKAVAFYDRVTRRAKDGKDIAFVIQHYLPAGNGGRLEGDLVTRAAQDREAAGAVLLGRDIRSVAAESTRTYLVERLHQETTSASTCPLAKVLAHRICKGNFARARKLLSATLEGLTHA